MLRRSFLFAALALAGAACKKQPPEKIYDMRGEVVSRNPQTRTATIKHEKIGDWMDAMTMEFPVRNPGDFDKLQPGRTIRGKVHTRPESFEYWLASVQVE